MADHSVSEAIYLWDPDGLGIEVYADRPRDAWQQHDRELVMTTDPLDIRSVMPRVETRSGRARQRARPWATSICTWAPWNRPRRFTTARVAWTKRCGATLELCSCRRADIATI
jgi:hypothetical protein